MGINFHDVNYYIRFENIYIMIIALDSYYKELSRNICNTSLVLFANETSSNPIYTDTIYTEVTSEYIPGEFYKREFPGIEKILTKFINEHPDWWQEVKCIICDSFVFLVREWKEDEKHESYSKYFQGAGLGRYIGDFTMKHPIKNIFNEDYIIPIIGVAKSNFGVCDQMKCTHKVYRGKSKTPLYVQVCWGFVGKYMHQHSDLSEYNEAFSQMEYATNLIQNMHGEYRIPTMLKLVDQLSRNFDRISLYNK